MLDRHMFKATIIISFMALVVMFAWATRECQHLGGDASRYDPNNIDPHKMPDLKLDPRTSVVKYYRVRNTSRKIGCYEVISYEELDREPDEWTKNLWFLNIYYNKEISCRDGVTELGAILAIELWFYNHANKTKTSHRWVMTDANHDGLLDYVTFIRVMNDANGLTISNPAPETISDPRELIDFQWSFDKMLDALEEGLNRRYVENFFGRKES